MQIEKSIINHRLQKLDGWPIPSHRAIRRLRSTGEYRRDVPGCGQKVWGGEFAMQRLPRPILLTELSPPRSGYHLRILGVLSHPMAHLCQCYPTIGPYSLKTQPLSC